MVLLMKEAHGRTYYSECRSMWSVPCDAKQMQLTAVEKQRSQLEKLLKDPAKPTYIPLHPRKKNNSRCTRDDEECTRI
jgi:hypothetical protein